MVFADGLRQLKGSPLLSCLNNSGFGLYSKWFPIHTPGGFEIGTDDRNISF
jgi:hypothetical protein